MEVDVLELLDRTGALQQGHFRLSSGLHSGSYVQCARLLEEPRDAVAIGAALADRLRDLRPERIVSPALGGVIIGFTVALALDVPMSFTERKEGEMVLRRGFRIGDGERVVIVEDVVTTGRSTRETAAIVREQGGDVAGFASILNRSGEENPFPDPYRALLSLQFETFTPEACPLCREGRPLDAPGSRYTGSR